MRCLAIFVIVTVAAASGIVAAADGQRSPAIAQISSEEYGFSISLPPGWIAVPDAEMYVLREEPLSTAGKQRIIIPAAFQRGFKGAWFEWPYAFVQIQATGRNTFPTPSQFESVVKSLTDGTSMAQARLAVKSTFTQSHTADMESVLAGTKIYSLKVDAAARRFSYVADELAPTGEKVRVRSASLFLSNGAVITLTCMSSRAEYGRNVKDFVALERTLHDLGHRMAGSHTP